MEVVQGLILRLKWLTSLTLVFLNSCSQSTQDFIEAFEENKACQEMSLGKVCALWHTPEFDQARSLSLNYRSWPGESVRLDLWVEGEATTIETIGAGFQHPKLKSLNSPTGAQLLNDQGDSFEVEIVTGMGTSGYRKSWQVFFHQLTWNEIDEFDWKLVLSDLGWNSGPVILKLQPPLEWRK